MATGRNIRSLGLLIVILLAGAAVVASAGPARALVSPPPSYRNPILPADFPDPDVIRVGADYYLVTSSFHEVPGLPILHSRDLVNWTLVSHAVPRLPDEFDRVRHGAGLWAPSLRWFDGFFWIYVGDPDRGILMTRARDPRGAWEPLTVVKEGIGLIDPCPFRDDDGSLYLVHAWARSRTGFNSVLTVNRMSADGRRVIDQGTLVFDGNERQPTIEGPKLYKRNGWYYIFAPAGGVKTGWQVVLRSRSILGPYEDKVVLQQGSTTINGPHQGAWVEAADGSSWFVHFQDRGAYGRVVHLQPMVWINDWPVIGEDRDGDGTGEPVLQALRPDALAADRGAVPAASDEFDATSPGLQWHWPGNPEASWVSMIPRRGVLRLSAVSAKGPNLAFETNLLLQKLPSETFVATALLDASALRRGDRAGLVIMGLDYSALVVERTERGLDLRRVVVKDAESGAAEQQGAAVALDGPRVHLRVAVGPGAVCRFSHSIDGVSFRPLPGAFVARPGRWIGARVGVFASADAGASRGGRADFDWFRVEPSEPAEAAALIVAADGSGDFATIQEALDALPPADGPNRIILIRNGTYREKLRITGSHLALVGEDRERTRIEFAELRRNWRASHPDDWGAAVINIGPDVTDLVLANLTVRNDYGSAYGDHDHQFAIRSMGNATRIAVLNANVVAGGGDTFSLWNAESGMSYVADSYFEGWVDFVCPRGWAYMTDSRFFSRGGTASLWHDGSRKKSQKLVVRHAQFDGEPGFVLGRNHRDAQFYIIDSTFSAQMADRPIAPVPAPDPRQWGERYYYRNTHSTAGRYTWAADNLETADGSPRSEDVTASWAFEGRWDPAALPAVLPFAAIPRPENGWDFVDPSGVTLRWTPGRNATLHRVHFGTENPPQFRSEQSDSAFATGPLVPGTTYYWRVDSVTPAGIVAGPVWSLRADLRDVRIALAGDSTMTEKSGWGVGFKAHVAESAAVLNLARGGRSSKSFATEGLWADLLRRRPTHVLIQFGHNDMPGKGADRETDIPTFRANLERFVDEARAAGAKPVLITPLTRRSFTVEGRVRSDLAGHAAATTEVALSRNVLLIDLHARSIELLDHFGPAAGGSLGPLKNDGTLDKTHLNAEGATIFGALIAGELRRVDPELVPHIRPVAPAALPVPPWSVRMAESVMKRTPDPMWLDATEKPRWEYTPGLVLKAVMDVALRTGDERYWNYVERYYDGMIDENGAISGGYRLDEYNIDRINPGKPLFQLHARTGEAKYRKAIEVLRQQLREHPRTSEGGFWHKKRYPHQMWLDGLYMGAPFLAQYAKVFDQPAVFDDVIAQFVLMEKHARDTRTGLLYHGWDESRQQKWADPETGRSPAFWGRAMGWYAMALVETLDFVPREHPRRRELIAILQRLAEAVAKVQDPASGLWWQVLDQGGREGNYLEASVSTMFSFALLKASRLGYVDARYRDVGRRAYEGILAHLIEVQSDGLVDIHRVCQVAGLGGDPEKERYRSGTYEYYVGEKVRSNDPKAVGPFIFASLEMERLK